jgi:hypothetical protein
MEVTLESAQGHTDGVEIRATLDEALHNVYAALSRGIMQCGIVVLIYVLVENEPNLEVGPGTYR